MSEQNRSQEAEVIEIQGNGSEPRGKELCGETRTGPRGSRELDRNVSRIRDVVWIWDPSPETVVRLIEWFSNENQ